MKEEDIKSYSLRVLEEMIEDALGAECRPDEIFNTIKLAAKRNANYHRICARDAQSLVDLLEGVDRTEKVVSISSGIKIDDLDREMFKLYHFGEINGKRYTLQSLADKTGISRRSIFTTIKNVKTYIKKRINEIRRFD